MTSIEQRLDDYAAHWQATAALPAVPDLAGVARRRRRWPAVASAAALVVVAGTGAAVLMDDPSAAPRPAPQAGPARGYDADVVSRRAAAFYGALGTSGASEAEHFPTLRAAASSATAVVVAEVTDVRVTRTLRDGVGFVGVTLRPVDVLNGELPSGDPVVVEILAGTDPVTDLRATLPDGFGVWLLRSKAPQGSAKPGAPAPADAGYYRLVSSQGLFVQGASHVVNPVRERPSPEADATARPVPPALPDPVAAEAEAFPRLSELIEHLRLMR
jgi:hypothetical protein